MSLIAFQTFYIHYLPVIELIDKIEEKIILPNVFVALQQDKYGRKEYYYIDSEKIDFEEDDFEYLRLKYPDATHFMFFLLNPDKHVREKDMATIIENLKNDNSKTRSLVFKEI